MKTNEEKLEFYKKITNDTESPVYESLAKAVNDAQRFNTMFSFAMQAVSVAVHNVISKNIDVIEQVALFMTEGEE